MAAAPLIPSWRLLTALLELLGTVVLYMNRINISFAIVCMTKAPGSATVMNGTANETDILLGSAINDSSTNSSVIYSSAEEAEFDWSRKLVGFIISSFYIGYIITQIPAGLAATRVSPKWLLVSGMVVTFLVSFLSPVAARAGWGYLVALQIIKGLACGFFYPAMLMIVCSWAAPHERSRLYTVAISGSNIGNIIGFLSAGYLCMGAFAGGWPAIFYICAMVGCVWLVLYIVFVHDNPDVHPFVSTQEREYLKKSLAQELSFEKEKKPKKIPWKSIFTSPPLYAILMAQAADCWLWYTAISCLPIYINDVLKFNVKENGLASSMPYVVSFLISWVSSYIADLVIEKRFLPTTIVRKLGVSGSKILPAVFIISVGFLKSHQYYIAVSLISASVGCLGFARLGNQVNTLDIAPRFTSVIVGIENTICTITGILAPIVTGQLTPNGTQAEWRRVFFLAGALSLVAQIVYAIFGSAEVQSWARPENDNFEDVVIPDQQLLRPLVDSEKQTNTTDHGNNCK